MHMQVVWELRRLQAPHPTTAVLLLTHDPQAIRDWITQAKPPAWPTIYLTHDGYLIRLPIGVPAPIVAIHLRSLAANLWLPSDAELLPTLHLEEAASLAAHRGLIFLPGQRVLLFDPESPLPLNHFLELRLQPPPLLRRLPQLPTRPDRIRTLEYVISTDELAELLDIGTPDGYDETAPQPTPPTGWSSRQQGRAQVWMAQFIGGLGRMFGIGALQRLGANLARGALQRVPQLTQEILGQQEAALRDLLREFREGDVEAALRRALPMGQDGRTQTTGGTGVALPEQSTRFNLESLLRMGQGGSANVWYGGANYQAELWNEYRRLANEAIARGDFRRAAFIHGHLLGDRTEAAGLLSRGGFHREAAILYREVVKNRMRAAQEFDKAGMYDEAIRLYREMACHVEAGDLLTRLGDIEAAFAEYEFAANILAKEGNFHSAGLLWMSKAGHLDRAEAMFRQGWEKRRDSIAHARNAFPCVMKRLEMQAERGDLESFWSLLAEVETELQADGQQPQATDLYRILVEWGDRFETLHPHRLRLRDRARMGLAYQLRRHALSESRAGTIVARLFGESGKWAPAVVGDAAYALQLMLRNRPPETVSLPRVRRLHISSVALVHCVAADDDECTLLLADAQNHVMTYSTTDDERDTLTRTSGPVAALAISRAASCLAIVERVEHDAGGGQPHQVLTLSLFGSTTLRHYPCIASRTIPLAPDTEWHLLSRIDHEMPAPQVHLQTGEMMNRFDGETLHLTGAHYEDCWTRFTLENQEHTTFLVCLDRVFVANSNMTGTLGWMPIDHPAPSWLQTGSDSAELVCLNRSNNVGWASIQYNRGLSVTSTTYSIDRGFAAACIWKSELVAAVGNDRCVYWLRRSNPQLVLRTPLVPTGVTSTVLACYACHKLNELVIVYASGELVFVKAPT